MIEMKMNVEKMNEEKNYLTLNEVFEKLENEPKPKFLWNGIKEKSFGLIFGPSKSGKSIFCENLGMSLAMGAKDFFGYKLEGIPKKILFLGLEEFWSSRGVRNKSQFDSISEQEQELVGENYRFQKLNFPKKIVGDKHWKLLIDTILDSKAEVVFIDSITRMNIGKLENSNDAEFIMQKLREVCYGLNITLICVHHTPKMYDSEITMDHIKGSSAFAQESDFAIAVTRNSKKHRYIKNVFFRYASDDDEKVKEFEIDSSCWLNYTTDTEETEILKRTDRRRTDKKETIIDFLDCNITTTYKKGELFGKLASELKVNYRQFGNHLKDLSDNGKINSHEKGFYSSINSLKIEKGKDGRAQ